MTFFDLGLGAWVRNPGSESPPQISPVLTIGATYSMEVQFVRGTEIQTVAGGSFYGGIKIKGDYSGDVVADDSEPVTDGQEAVIFTLDLGTTEGKAYFTANPTDDSVSAAFVVVATIDGTEFKTPPFEITLQNDYFSDK